MKVNWSSCAQLFLFHLSQFLTLMSLLWILTIGTSLRPSSNLNLVAAWMQFPRPQTTKEVNVTFWLPPRGKPRSWQHLTHIRQFPVTTPQNHFQIVEIPLPSATAPGDLTLYVMEKSSPLEFPLFHWRNQCKVTSQFLYHYFYLFLPPLQPSEQQQQKNSTIFSVNSSIYIPSSSFLLIPSRSLQPVPSSPHYPPPI
jgi:hypothetical protein